MKIVINSCFGGFGLSHAAVMKYALWSGITVYAWMNARTGGGGISFNEYVTYDPKEKPFIVYYSIAPLVGGKIPEGKWFTVSDIPRNDPTLVRVVEEMGEDANDSHAELKIVEIPDGVEWEIDEYDGSETVDEKHRSWS